MSLADKFSVPGRSGSDVRHIKTPEEWRPRMEVDENGGYAISIPKASPPEAMDILKEFDLDPDQWVVTSVRRSKWQRYDEEWLHSARVNIVPAAQMLEDKADIHELYNIIKKHKPGKKAPKTSGDLAFVFAPSDQQLGKKQGDAGTEQTIKRILNATDGAVQRLKDLRKIGREVGTVVIALLGDHVEGNVSQGGKLQSHSVSDLGLTEQIRVGRRLLFKQIEAFAPLADKVIVAVVNGNHDEVSRQVALDPAEGWNTEIASQVQDGLALNDGFSHVEFRYPAKSHQTLAVDVCGTMLGLFHGHQTGKDVMRYLSEQAAGQTSLGNCDVWLSGHYHNFRSMDIGSRFWAQGPTVDPGSAWFRDRHGLESNSGILTMVIGKGHDPRLDVSVIPA